MQNLAWPQNPIAIVAPEEKKPPNLNVAGPTACIQGNDAFWACGGSDKKARMRVVEDERGMLTLKDAYTVGIRFRIGRGEKPGYDSLMLDGENQHWLAVHALNQDLLFVNGTTGDAIPLNYTVPLQEWVVVFLQPRGDYTAVFVLDNDGLLELSLVNANLAKKKLRSMGWADNVVHIASLMVWDRCVSWGEMSGTVSQVDVLPSPVPSTQPAASFKGEVVDTAGYPIQDVTVKWGKYSCVTDEDGCFGGSLSDAETDVPDDAASGLSTASSVDFFFSGEGFAPTSMVAQCSSGDETPISVTLRPISASVKIDVATGGALVDSKTGSSLTVPPDSLVYSDGTQVTGPVTVSFSVIDAMDPASLASMPGDFSAVGADGSTVYLQSLGAAWVDAVDEKGQQLAVRPGSAGLTLDLKSHAAADSDKLGAIPEMWSFNEASGKWEMESVPMKLDGELAPTSGSIASGEAEGEDSDGEKKFYRKKGKYGKKGKIGGNYNPNSVSKGCMSAEDFKKKMQSSGQKSISSNITKLGYINCDIAYDHPTTAVMMAGVVLNSQGQPFPNTQLWSVGRNYQGRCADATDSAGKFGALIAQFDSDVDIEVHIRKPIEGDSKMEVYFDHRDWKKSSARKELEELPGYYKWNGAVVGGQPVWELQRSKYLSPKEKEELPSVTIEWLQERRQWHHKLGIDIMFIKDADDIPASPFGTGWRPGPALGTDAGLIALLPTYARPMKVHKYLVGPFKTGAPGQFTDVGTIVVDA